MSTFDLEIAF